MRNALVGAGLGVVAVAGLVGSMLVIPAHEPAPEPEPQEVAVQAALLQSPEDEHPQLCQGFMESHPPQCAGGRDVLGDVDWSAIDGQEESGTRWAEDVWVVGEPTASSFTLSRPASLEQPEGVVVVSIDQLR